MDNGITFAKQINLRPGIALTDAQVAALVGYVVEVKIKQPINARGMLPAPSEIRSVEEIALALNRRICGWAVSAAIPTPGSTMMQPIYDAAGKIVVWAAEKASGASVKAAAGALICN